MKIFVNIALLLILLALLVLAVTVPRQWSKQEQVAATPTEQTGFALKEKETGQATLEPAKSEPKPEPVIEAEKDSEPPLVTPSAILEIVSKLQRGESKQAALLINDALESLDDNDAIALQSIVSTETARAEQMELMATQLDDSNKELAQVEENSRKALDESLKTLAIATKRAEEATAESKEHSKKLEEKNTQEVAAAEEMPPTSAPSEKAVKLPENDLIDFSFGSTFLSDANKAVLSKAIETLNGRNELVIQLRGHTDTIGEPQYNAILANARCEMARDFLIEQGIDNSRISIVSFGESQVFKDGVVAEKPRRVEILFRKKN